MNSFNPFNSTIFNKVVMAITGFILVGFIIGHALGNLQVFLGRDVFNSYAHFLQSSGELLWIVRIVLFVSAVLHIITSLKLKFLNLSAKPEGYSMKGFIKSTVYSRTMIYTGIVVLLFLIYHLLHFTLHVTAPEYATFEENYGPRVEAPVKVETENGVKIIPAGEGIFVRHDAYKMVITGFSKPIISIVYILAVFFLGLHLAHAIQSMFQTLGFSGPRLTPNLILISKVIGWGIFLAFASIPTAVLLFGLGKGVIG